MLRNFLCRSAPVIARIGRLQVGQTSTTPAFADEGPATCGIFFAVAVDTPDVDVTSALITTDFSAENFRQKSHFFPNPTKPAPQFLQNFIASSYRWRYIVTRTSRDLGISRRAVCREEPGAPDSFGLGGAPSRFETRCGDFPPPSIPHRYRPKCYPQCYPIQVEVQWIH